MIATLHNHSGTVIGTAKVDDRRAFPQYLVHGDKLFECRNTTSVSGNYDQLGQVTIVENLEEP